MLLPDEWIEDSIETYIYQRTTKSQVIYWIVLLFVMVTLVALPFIYVDISVQGNGMVRPIAEKSEINAVLTEQVDSIYVREGQQIHKGELILRFRTGQSDHRIGYQKSRLSDCEKQLADLELLSIGKSPSTFSSMLRKQESIYYDQRKHKLEIALAQAKKNYKRNQVLFEKQVISEEEYDRSLFDYQDRKDELQTLIESQLKVWQSDLSEYRRSYDEIKMALQQEVKSRAFYLVRSPVNGTVDQFSGIYSGSNVQAGQLLAVISPDSTLYLETYVEPRNIGLISIGMPINAQIESFNYAEWGTIPGRVKEISSDFQIDHRGRMVFKVKCEIKRYFLQLKNGRIGRLRKGMTANVHFMVTRRSLFDLLYQTMDDWVNPKQYNDEAKVM